MIEALIRFSPSMSSSDVHIVSSDAFLDEKFIQQFFPRANFVLDRYHLVEAIKTRVGLAKWSHFEESTYAMLNADSESKFNAAIASLVAIRPHGELLKIYAPVFTFGLVMVVCSFSEDYLLRILMDSRINRKKTKSTIRILKRKSSEKEQVVY